MAPVQDRRCGAVEEVRDLLHNARLIRCLRRRWFRLRLSGVTNTVERYGGKQLLKYQSVNPDYLDYKYVRYKEVNSVALGLAAKKEIVAEINDVASRALSVAVAEYRGMEVAELTDLRVKAREQGVYLRVVRNTLAKRALADSKFADLDSALTGPLIYGFSIEAPGGAARLFKDYSKANDKLKVTALSIGSGLLGPEKLDAVASLPTRDEALAKLLATFKAPVGKFVRTINEVPSKFVRVLAAIKDEK